jgi:ATP-binding cassette subfamily F protein 3
MRSKDILKNALKEYDGTLILVSHDREFLDGLVNKVYEFKDHKIKEYLGGIYDFLQKKKIDSFRELERKEESVEITKSVKNSDNKVQYEKRKEQDKIIRKVKSELEKLESKIENVEDEIKKVSDLLVDPEKISDKELFNLYEKYRSEHDKLLNRWEQLNIDLEKLIGNRI